MDSIHSEWKRTLRSVNETVRLGCIIGEALRGGEVLGLQGLVGAGKTTLVRGIAAGLRADPNKVASPTFVLINEYRGRLAVHHADLYRIESVAEALDLGLEELFASDGVTLIEWAEKLGAALPADAIRVHIAGVGDEPRRISIASPAPGSAL